MVVPAVDAPVGEVTEVDLGAGAGVGVAAPAGGVDLDGAADRAGLVGGVTGLHGVRVVGAGLEAGVRVRRAGDGRDDRAVPQHVVVLDAVVVGRGGPAQLGRGVGDGARGGGARCRGGVVAGDAAAVAGGAVQLAAGGGAGAGAVEAEADGGAGGDRTVPAEVLGGPVGSGAGDGGVPGGADRGAGGEVPLDGPGGQGGGAGVLHRPLALEAAAPVGLLDEGGGRRGGGLGGGGQADHRGEREQQRGEARYRS
ncbi:hypothetical protein EES42_01975 [Streptomyces sp. ADI95-17]|nr:hypothetical protein EES42_01975 [Streptomyces sp. ADI95-17]